MGYYHKISFPLAEDKEALCFDIPVDFNYGGIVRVWEANLNVSTNLDLSVINSMDGKWVYPKTLTAVSGDVLNNDGYRYYSTHTGFSEESTNGKEPI